MSGIKQHKAIVRTWAGMVLLLWLACPVCIGFALWTSEWRWAATGVLALLTGFAAGAVMVAGKRRQ